MILVNFKREFMGGYLKGVVFFDSIEHVNLIQALKWVNAVKNRELTPHQHSGK